MTRRFRHWNCFSAAEASGAAIVRDNELEMTGTYLNGRCRISEGMPVEFVLQQAGQRLEALSLGADPLTPTLMLYRVHP
jgi:hypothetical protein